MRILWSLRKRMSAICWSRVSFALAEETVQPMMQHFNDPETAFNVMVNRRRADGQACKRKRHGTRHICQVLCGSLARSRRLALMKMHWGRDIKDDGQLKARLAVQGYTDQGRGKITTSFQPRPVDRVRFS